MATEALGQKFKRNLSQYQHSDGDVEIGPFMVEVKNVARLSVKAWWQQAVAQAKARGLVPALAYKVERKGWRVVTPIPEAWASGNCWRELIEYTDTTYPEGFWLKVREGFS